MPAARFAYLDHPRPIAFAHRGGTEAHPENTMAAFAHAVSLGYRYVETDVQVTRDGVLLAFHDPTLERMTDRAGAVEALPWAEVRQARIAGSESIPRLEELLTAWPDLRVNIDPKCDAAVVPLADVIEKTSALDRICVASFSEARVREARRRLGPRLCTALGPVGVFRLRLASVGLPVGRFDQGAVQVPVRHHGLPIVDRPFIRAAHRNDVQVHVWTVNAAAEMDRLLDLGVDGLMSDETTLLKSVMQRRGLWTGG